MTPPAGSCKYFICKPHGPLNSFCRSRKFQFLLRHNHAMRWHFPACRGSPLATQLCWFVRQGGPFRNANGPVRPSPSCWGECFQKLPQQCADGITYHFLSMFIIDIMDLASKSSIPVHGRQAVARCLPNGLSALQDYQPGWKLRNRMS